jgi:UDP-glucose 6-dehydrogenase
MILVIGCGFVGEAVATNLESNGRTVTRIDPKYNDNKISDYINHASCAIVAVPTPTIDGVCDDSAIRSVLGELGDIRVLLKCTVPPNMIDTYGANVTYNPEFLRAKTAAEDFKNQKHFILGTDSTLDAYFWEQKFGYLEHAEFIRTDRKTASMIKYVHNNWLAMKVTFFHEIFNCVGNEYNHFKMIEVLADFENIGPSHMAAPNDEGLLGYGGHCFPKDTEAFYDFTNSELIKQMIETNNRLRNEK